MRIIFLLLLIFPSHIYAASKRSVLMFGTGIAGFNFFVDDKNGNREASMVNKSQFTPFVGYTRMPKPFWSKWSWLRGSLEMSASPFSADRQNTGRITTNDGKRPIDGVDLGTKVNGLLGYINPSLIFFYHYTDTIYLYAGIGVGAGFASIRGDYYNVTGRNISASCRSSSRAQDIISNCKKEDVHYSGFGISSKNLIVLSLGWFGMKFELGGPGVNADGKKYTTFSSMFSVFAQYRF